MGNKKRIKTKFKLSEDGTYWIGTTSRNHEFWFDGDKEIVEYIKSCSWRKLNTGYFQNGKGERLHRVVMKALDKPDIFINHLGGNRWDNRRNKLTISDCSDNSKEKKTYKGNNSGIIGLLKRKNKWVGNVKANNVSIYSRYKTKEEALIDLLIMQRHYGFRHNESIYYLLDDISQDRIDEVISNCERQLNKKRDDKICSKNKLKLSKDKNFYWVYDKNNNKFKISVEDKDKMLKGIWYVANDGEMPYVKGFVIIDGVRTTTKLHRYLLDLLDVKYRKWYVSHDNGDGLDNTRTNLVITDFSGNCLNKPAKGYHEADDGRTKKFRSSITINKITYKESFQTKEDAINWFFSMREKALKERIQFKTREELDEYLNVLHIKNAS